MENIGASIATTSPLFVPEFCLYSDTKQYEIALKPFLLNQQTVSLNYAPKDVLSFFLLLFEHNCRVSELLSLRPCDCLKGNLFLVRGKKRSRSFTITVPGLWLSRPSKKDGRWQVPIFTYTYDYLYKWSTRIGIGGTRPGRKTFVRTHTARYVVAQSVFEIAGEKAAGDCLRHNSRKSVSFYLNKQEFNYGKD